MGLGGISIWQLLIVLAIVVLLFGTSRLRTIGGDLGSAVRGFRNSMQGADDSAGNELDEAVNQSSDASPNEADARIQTKETPAA